MKRHNGRTLAKKTGWDLILIYPAVGQERHRGSVSLATHPKLPGWLLGHRGRKWALAAPDGITIRTEYLWQAIESGNRVIASGGIGDVTA